MHQGKRRTKDSRSKGRINILPTESPHVRSTDSPRPPRSSPRVPNLLHEAGSVYMIVRQSRRSQDVGLPDDTGRLVRPSWPADRHTRSKREVRSRWSEDVRGTKTTGPHDNTLCKEPAGRESTSGRPCPLSSVRDRDPPEALLRATPRKIARPRRRRKRPASAIGRAAGPRETQVGSPTVRHPLSQRRSGRRHTWSDPIPRCCSTEPVRSMGQTPDATWRVDA